MEALIVWLPAIGFGILLTTAITAWFTPDRQLVAVWFGFAGFCLLLLTIALQLHVYVTTSILQPKIELASPPAPSHFRWDTSVNWSPVLRGPNDQSPAGNSNSPIFSISNASPILAADLSIEWTAPALDVAQLGANYPQFKRYVQDVKAGSYEIVVPSGPGLPDMRITNPGREEARINIPFLNRPTETFLPIEVWWRAMPIVIAKLPQTPGHEEFELEFGATVTWNIPDRGTPQKFVLVASVRNTKTANDQALMDADITWFFRAPPQ